MIELFRSVLNRPSYVNQSVNNSLQNISSETIYSVMFNEASREVLLNMTLYIARLRFFFRKQFLWKYYVKFHKTLQEASLHDSICTEIQQGIEIDKQEQHETGWLPVFAGKNMFPKIVSTWANLITFYGKLCLHKIKGRDWSSTTTTQWTTC